MKKIILIAFVSALFWGCYTQIGTLKEDEGYSTSKPEYKYYSENYDYAGWYYQRYVYRYYLPYPRYYLFFRYYTPSFAIGWGEWWYYDPYWFDYYWWNWYWWDRYYWWDLYWYLPTWYYYPWWYRAPVIVVINNYPYYSGGGRTVVFRSRNFGSTREGVRDERMKTESSSQSVAQPSRNAPLRGSGGSVQSGSSDEGSLRKSSSSGGRTPAVERGGGERTRGEGSTRAPSTPRVVPRSNDGNSGTPRQDSTPPRKTDQPRRIGTNRNSIQIYRNYETGRNTLIEMPKHDLPNVLNNSSLRGQPSSSTGFSQPEQRQEQKRHMGNRR